MKHIFTYFCLILLTIFIIGGHLTSKEEFPVLKGPYLGQKPPGKIPEIFAPGLITTHYSQSYIAFLNEARVCVYSATTEKGHETFYTYEKNGCWTSPQKAPFEELQGHPNYTTGPLGRKVYFHSGNPTHPNDTSFSSFELLYLCKEMMCEKKDSDADLFFSALDKVMPNVLLVKEGYAQLCVMNGRVSKGLKILQKLALDDPNFNLGDSLSGIGYLLTLYPDKTEDALSVLKLTVEKFPEDPWPYYSLARIYRKMGNLEKAIENCRKALEIKPGVGDISQLLERLLQEKEKHKKDFISVSK